MENGNLLFGMLYPPFETAVNRRLLAEALRYQEVYDMEQYTVFGIACAIVGVDEPRAATLPENVQRLYGIEFPDGRYHCFAYGDGSLVELEKERNYERIADVLEFPPMDFLAREAVPKDIHTSCPDCIEHVESEILYDDVCIEATRRRPELAKDGKVRDDEEQAAMRAAYPELYECDKCEKGTEEEKDDCGGAQYVLMVDPDKPVNLCPKKMMDVINARVREGAETMQEGVDWRYLIER